jgi:hypothetical protein
MGKIGRIDLALQKSNEVEIAVRVVGADPGWCLELDGEKNISDSALLLLPWRTGIFSYTLTDADGLHLASGTMNVPHGAREWRLPFDVSHRRPGEAIPRGHEPEDPPPPDTGDGTPTPPGPEDSTPTPPEAGE